MVLIYTVSDLSGNTASAERRITVKDIVPPVLTLNGEKNGYTFASSDKQLRLIIKLTLEL